MMINYDFPKTREKMIAHEPTLSRAKILYHESSGNFVKHHTVQLFALDFLLINFYFVLKDEGHHTK